MQGMRSWAAAAIVAITLLAESASAGLIGDTIRVVGVNTNDANPFLDATVVVGAAQEIDRCTFAPGGVCAHRVVIDFVHDGVNFTLFNLTGNSYALPSGRLSYFGIDGPGPLLGLASNVTSFPNQVTCMAATRTDLRCDYSGYVLPPGATFRSVARFAFATPVSAPTSVLVAGCVLVLGLMRLRHARAMKPANTCA